MNKRHYEHTLPNIRGSLSNTYIGLFILKNLKFKDMKLRLIENICKRTVSLVLLTGICLLYSKGIIPVYLIVLFLLSGTIIGFFFRAFLLVIKVILILSVMGMLV